MKKSVIEKLNAALDGMERGILNYVEEHECTPISALREIHQDHQVVLYFRDVLARRYAEQPKDDRVCRDETIAILDKLIAYHNECIHLCIRKAWSVDDHRSASETLKSIRDHLDRCYEIRSCA